MSFSTLPLWRFSAFYFFFFGSIGALMPYWSLYLKSLGMQASEIGLLMALTTGTKMISPYVWGWLSDHTGHRVRVIRLGAILAWLIFFAIFFGTSFLWLAIMMPLFGFFWYAVLPQFEAATFQRLGNQTHRYSRIRLWGSIGFILAVVLTGEALEIWQVDALLFILIGLLSGIAIATFGIKDYQEPVHQHHSVSIARVLKQPHVIALFFVCFTMQFSHGPYYTFYSIHLRDIGYGHFNIGLLWALGVVAEIVVFVYLSHLLPRFQLRFLLLLSLLLATVRWLIIGHLSDSVVAIISAQFLHAASFGIYHAAAIQLIHRWFPGKLQGRGQALYSSVSFGAGGAMGSLLSGFCWQSYGASVTFTMAAVGSFLGLLVGYRWLTESSEKAALSAN